jgi:SAM-dependent methyltransferase
VTGQVLVTDAAAFKPAERFVHVLHVGDSGVAPMVTATEAKGTVSIRLTAGDRTFSLALPTDPGVVGQIAVSEGDKAVLAKRLLPASIMPHGAKGVAMMERWDSSYRRTDMPGWDVGRPASELKAIVENGTIKPGKALVLGCGTGTNAVYLASKGFEVTAVDVAPTALVLAEQRARKAKVRVRWLVADVVVLPDIGSFDFIFDRGCYHHVQKYDAAGFVKSIDLRTAAGAHFLLLAGNANEPRHGGPPRVEETQLVDNFAGTWDFVSLKEIRFESRDPNRKNGPWAWSALMRRRAPKKK